MSAAMQLLVAGSWCLLVSLIVRRAWRSPWADMRVIEIPRELRRSAGRRTLDEVLAAAREELRSNPSITVYTFENGVEHREPACIAAMLRAAIDQLAHITLGVDEFGKAVGKAFASAFKRLDADQ